MDSLNDIVKEFLIESYDNLQRLDRDLLALEKNPKDVPTLSSIFRTIHTIKGTCGFLGFSKLESVTHVGENLLSKLRDGLLTLRPDIATDLLLMVDAVREMLSSIESTGTDGNKDFAALIAELKEISESTDASGTASVEMVKQAIPSISQEPRQPIPASVPSKSPVPAQPETAGGLAETSIRVDINVLDQLMTLAGELVLTRNQLQQFTTVFRDAAFARTNQRLNLITTELQQGVMKARMQPIGNVFDRFPRVVRDLANQVGKKIRLEVDGRETELDRTVIEAIKDPLTHVVRNSVDHGIEKPEIRLARGKPEEGVLRLRAFHEGGLVNIEIADDGGGIPPDKVKAKAIEKGLITPDQAARMTDREAVMLIFAPGFSTAEQVTNISGRGVGMDVVRTNVEKIGGTLDVTSAVGVGTTLKVKIPLTLAIVPALIVICDGDRYAIPQVNLLELVHIDPESKGQKIESIQGSPIYRLRGRLLPISFLRDRFHAPPADPIRPATIAVLQADGRQFGLVVDSVMDTQEIVVKPLSQELKALGLYAGTTILGDGRVALILDIPGLTIASGLSAGSPKPAVEPPKGPRFVTLLLLELTAGRRIALPMTKVTRLEKVPTKAIERVGNLEVFQYRKEIIPLARLADLIGHQSTSVECETVPIVIYADGSRTIGLIADTVVDIVEVDLKPHRTASRRGIPATAVIHGRVTELLEMDELLNTFDFGLEAIG